MKSRAANLCAATLAMVNPSISPASYFRIVSAWSKAGIGTSVVLETKPFSNEECASSARKGTRIVFDIGATPTIDEAFTANVVIISHGHIDHIGAIFNHARAHSVMFGGSIPTYYVPIALVPKLELSRQAMSSIDAANDGAGTRTETLLKMNIIGVDAGDEIELKQKKVHGGMRLILRAFAVDHGGHPALGYVVATRKAPGLKPEYQGLPGERIRELAKSGVKIKGDPVDTIEVAYTGDSCARGLLFQPEHAPLLSHKASLSLDDKRRRSNAHLNQAFRAPLILCELTFLDPSGRDLASSRGHMHILDVTSVLTSHGWDSAIQEGTSSTRKIILFHLSSRHGPAERALDSIVDQLPLSIAKCCDVAISSMITEEERQSDIFPLGLVKNNGCISLTDYMKFRESRTSS